MTVTLRLTGKEINELINNRLDTDRFKPTFDNIPMYHPDHTIEPGETHYQYQEDDGRQYRWLIFNDTLTNIEYCLNYIYHPEFPNDLMSLPDSIQIVENPELSSIYSPPQANPEPEKEPDLSPAQLADRELWNTYKAIEPQCKVVERKERLKIPKEKINEILEVLCRPKFSMLDLRAAILPVCIEYQLDQRTFWQWIQSKSTAKKNGKTSDWTKSAHKI